MKFRFNDEFTEMTSTLSGCTAREIDADVWVVSWLDGEWTKAQANSAMVIAEVVAVDPPVNNTWWRVVESFLTDLSLDASVLSNLDALHSNGSAVMS